MRKLEHTIRIDATFPHDTSHQVQMVTEDFREFIQLFDQKNREYGSENAFVLGSAGQFADIWRKIGKLKTALWDKKPEQLTSEGTEEIIHDLMGHLFLTLQCLRRESNDDTMAKWLKPRANLAPNPTPERMTAGIDSKVEATYFDGTTGGVLASDEWKAKVKDERMESKRAKVLELYPQIGRGSLEARNEESLDWLISAAKPEEAMDVDPREYKFPVGAKVRNLNDSGWLANAVGVVRKQDRVSAGMWYIVDFPAHAEGITMSERTLELVK